MFAELYSNKKTRLLFGFRRMMAATIPRWSITSSRKVFIDAIVSTVIRVPICVNCNHVRCESCSVYSRSPMNKLASLYLPILEPTAIGLVT